jgi:hypothetical protein
MGAPGTAGQLSISHAIANAVLYLANDDKNTWKPRSQAGRQTGQQEKKGKHIGSTGCQDHLWEEIQLESDAASFYSEEDG